MTVIGSSITLQVRDYDEALEPHKENDDADDQQVQQALATTPTMPSTIATITSRRKRAIS